MNLLHEPYLLMCVIGVFAFMAVLLTVSAHDALRH